ncbi:hypothetical protein AJ80_09501 [Polytolypa hystricis UAMH7299]|uniref:Ecp2 effector protein domain-containing protein n=1 Tax=Polytolypa hystricis (strain UAMH7299) TaxID=1447883 RepID=A0A2B7WPU0_POLH7|nr:hypothetical protein AJ80_09501 [Polytolypa hystricis UAMH7299]
MQVKNVILALAAGLDGLVRAVSVASVHSRAAVTMSPLQSCSELNERYVTRSTLNDILENQFCPDAVRLQLLGPRSNSIEWIYNNNTPEMVAISVNWEGKPTFKLTRHDCLRFLRDMVLDGCHGNDKNNPRNWKGGGRLQVDGVVYKIEPLAQRQPYPKEHHGGCSVTHHDNYHHIAIWGNGWANSDWGEMLESRLGDCDLLSDTFNFAYGMGKDGREWNVTMYTITWKAGCLVEAAKSAGAPDNFTCEEST